MLREIETKGYEAGHWRKATPSPVYNRIWIKCSCGKRFLRESSYRTHYKNSHIKTIAASTIKYVYTRDWINVNCNCECGGTFFWLDDLGGKLFCKQCGKQQENTLGERLVIESPSQVAQRHVEYSDMFDAGKVD